jgi:CRP-like cAMP-binding protein
MYDALKETFNRVVQLSDADWAYALPLFKYVEYKKGELILREGEVHHHSIFILSGALRIYNFNGQKESIRNIFLEHSMFNESASYFLKKPSLYNLDAIEATKAFILHRNDAEALFSRSIPLATIGRKFAEFALATVVERNNELTSMDSKTRYLKLLKEKPHIFQRVPQYMIASYLGITPEALSRIRREIQEQ